jgi:ABC-2 type transport system permease protein
MDAVLKSVPLTALHSNSVRHETRLLDLSPQPRRSIQAPRCRFTLNALMTIPASATANEQAQFAYNGTFFDLGYFPSLGYDQGRELDNPVRRREARPWPIEELPDRGDAYGMNTDLFGPDSDFITYHTVVSTTPARSLSLPAICNASGSRMAAITSNTAWVPRRFRTSSVTTPANYAVKRDNWNGRKLEIYYLPSHTRDLDKMIGSIQGRPRLLHQELRPISVRPVRSLSFLVTAPSRSPFPIPFPFPRGSVSLDAWSGRTTSTSPGL